MNPHKLTGFATYSIECPFKAMSLASKIGGDVFIYSLGLPDSFAFAITLGEGAILFNRNSMNPCDKNGREV